MTDSTSLSNGKQFTPHDYQKRAILKAISQGGAGLFMDPGLGKTVSILSAFMVLHKKGLAKKMLVIAPLRPCYKVWPDEITKWAHTRHLSYAILHGPNKADALDSDSDIYIINPAGLPWLFDPKSKRPDFDVLCIDESTQFKNTQSQRFKLIKAVLPTFKRRWILTGTPTPNGLLDLFGQIYILDGGRALGRYVTHFRLRYFYQPPGQIYTWIPRPGAHKEVAEEVKELVIQLSAEDYLAMPELVYRNVDVKLPADARRVYDQVEENFISILDNEKLTAGNAAVAGMKCRQIANGAVYNEFKDVIPVHDEKLDALENLLGELEGHPVIILYEFEHDKTRIQARIKGCEVLGGNLSQQKLGALIDGFNRGTVPILLGHPASMGHGLNLQGACHHVIWFGITWNLEHYDQAIARVYRQGQDSSHVFIYHIVAEGTVDERVLKTLTAKDRAQQNLLAALHERG